jgi:hypothetical protein
MGTGLANQTQEGGNAQSPDLLGDPRGVLRKGIEQMGQTHELMKPFHRIPIIREGVLVVIPLALFHLHVDFDPPAIPRAQVTAFMEAVSMAGPTGEPHMAAAFVNNSGAFALHFLPVFFTHDDMNGQVFLVMIVVVVDVVDPPKVLVAPTPGLDAFVLRLPRAQTGNLFPDARQAQVGQHNHLMSRHISSGASSPESELVRDLGYDT